MGALVGDVGTTITKYNGSEVAGLGLLVSAGCLSGFAVWLAFVVIAIRTPQYKDTHVMTFFCSLLVANLLQAAGGAMNAKWAVDRATEPGDYCKLQGGLKQAGNVGMAVWTFALSAHLFTLLFLRWKHTQLGSYLTLGAGWFFTAFIVFIGPVAIEDNRGPYFTPTGLWCWISDAYPDEQFWLEYFFEFLSSGLSIIIYSIILLRVRGNIYKSDVGWRLRFLHRFESWQLAIQRDVIDTSMLRVAARMVWFPVAYTVLLLPMAICRFLEMRGVQVAYWATIVTGTIFNLQGLVNILLLVITTRVVPDLTVMPDLSVPRRTIDMSSPERFGITPFILPPKSPEASKEVEEKDEGDAEAGQAGLSRSETVSSADSSTPMVRPRKPPWSLIRPSSWTSSKRS